jgi:phage recombination protein Bet
MSVTAIQPAAPAQLAPMFTPEQERMILTQFLGGASKEEAHVLLEIVKRRKLDPFARQVYFVKRWDSQKREEVWAIQTSIDGLRSIAERTGKYDGQDDPVYGKDDFGEFCKVRVYRKDWSAGRAAVGTAYLAEFIQKKKDGTITQFWARMPRLMLAKCAEALAIRKAFPEDTGGLYVAEEMGEEPKPAPAVEVLPAEGAREAPRQEAPSRAELVAALVPKPEPAKSTAPPPHAMKLWGDVKRAKGEEKSKDPVKTRTAFEDAALAIWGEKPKPSHEWTPEDTAKVREHILGPQDIQF